MTKIKMIGLDLDGTVFDNEKHISEENKKAIREALKAGIIVLPATGRPLIGLPQEMLDIEGIRYALTSNGGAIYDLETRQAVYEDCIPNKTGIEIAEALKQADGLAEVYLDGVCYADKQQFERALQYPLPPSFIEYMKVSRIPVEHLTSFIQENGRGIQKMHMIFGSQEARRHGFEILKQFNELAVTSAMSFNIEVNKKSADKGSGLLALGKLLGIKKEEIMACGDAGNDLEMFKKIGFAVAMGNAEPEIKAAADAVTKSNEEDGVALAIRKYALGK